MKAAVFSALGEPSKLQIVELLRTNSFTVGELVETGALAAALGLGMQPSTAMPCRSRPTIRSWDSPTIVLSSAKTPALSTHHAGS